MSRPFSSQLITRRCLAASTADVLLMDQPRKRSWTSEMVWCLLLLGVASSPTPLGAASRMLDASSAPVVQSGVQPPHSGAVQSATGASGDVPASDQQLNQHPQSSDGACIVESK